MKHRLVTLALVGAFFVAGCDNSNQPGGGGPISAALVSPNGSEGAAVLDVVGTVDSVTAPSDVSVYTTPSANGLRVVLVRQTAGSLSMSLNVPDISKPPAVTVVEVAGPDDALRQSLTGYRVELQ